MLRWDWNEKVGEATFVRTFKDEDPKVYTTGLYVGNAYLIFIYEYKEDGKDKYSLSGLFVDKTHMNRCLGIDKKYKQTYGKNMYEESYDKLTKIRLNKKKCDHTREIVDAFTKAFDNINIEIYSE